MKNRSNIIKLLFGIIPMLVAFSAVAAEPEAEPAVAAKPGPRCRCGDQIGP